MISKKSFRRNSKGFFGQSQKLRGVFWPKTGDLQNKNKKVFAEILRVFSAKVRNSKGFSGRKQVIFKKKRSSPTVRELQHQKSPLFCSKQRQVLNSFSFQIPLGGLFSFLEQKIGLKSTKNVLFCILFRPMEGSYSPPRPRYTTDKGQSQFFHGMR